MYVNVTVNVTKCVYMSILVCLWILGVDVCVLVCAGVSVCLSGCVCWCMISVCVAVICCVCVCMYADTCIYVSLPQRLALGDCSVLCVCVCVFVCGCVFASCLFELYS